MKLLIVDDEVWSRQLIKKILPWNEYGFDEILEASDGDEAILIYETRNIDLTITDMRMPGTDGAMLLQYLRENDYATEVIVMSGYEDYKYLHEALKVKAIDYLLKPIVKEELIKAVTTGIDRISDSKSYLYLEEILIKNDLSQEFNTFYEIKNNLFHCMINANESDFLKYLNQLEVDFFYQPIDVNLKEYIISILSRFVVKLEMENYIENKKHSMTDFNEIKTRFMNVFYIMKDLEKNKKISILEVQRYIDNHFTDVITLTNIAERFFTSKEHLSRLFKREIGITVQQYITNKKMEYAKRLLRRNNAISISSVSLLVGYIDLQYFYRVFKKHTGDTPMQYREKNQYNPTEKSI